MEERNSVNHVLDHYVPSIEQAIGLWRSLPLERRRPVLRDRLVDLYVRWEANEYMRARDVAQQEAGIPGPQGSLVKFSSGDLNQAIYELCLDLIGADGMLYTTYEMTRPTSWLDFNRVPAGDFTRTFLRSRAATIEGGTNEVQRNTIAERVLGLPREPKP
jgi:alkylation response protein AidB-like acyl-CoA dehydrogenase